MAQIYDYLGRPVKPADLTEEIATVSISSVRPPAFNQVSSGLSPERLANILNAADANDIMEYVTLAKEMEERDLHYSSVLGTRKRAVSGLNVVVEASTDKREDKKIADALREVVEHPSFVDLTRDLLDALGKGFAVSEIMWDKTGRSWYPCEYVSRDQRHFMFDRETYSKVMLRDPKDLVNGIPLAPYKFVQHFPKIITGIPIRTGLARLASIAYMCKSYGVKDWLAFAEVFGMPLRVGKYSTSATPDQKMALLQAVSSIGSDASCIIPDTMVIDFQNASTSSGGDVLFERLANWMDSQVSKGVLGQTMTTDNGSSLSQAQVHNDVREDIRVDDAQKLAATIRRDVVKPFVDLNFGQKDAREYPYIRFEIDELEDLESLATSLPPFIKLGLRVRESDIRDKFGLEEPAEGEALLGQSQQPAAPTDQPLTQSRQDVLMALSQKVLAGHQLTTDQRLLLSTMSRSTDHDAIDAIADDGLDDWRATMSPVLDPIAELARTSKSFEEFIQGIETLGAKMDPEKFMKLVATMTFKARGVGDATNVVPATVG